MKPKVVKMNLWRSIMMFGLIKTMRYRFRMWLYKKTLELIFEGGMDYAYGGFKKWAKHKSSNNKYKIYAERIGEN